MKENFKADYGIWVKENFPAADVFFFYNLQIKDIQRIGLMEYSLFTTYQVEGVDYALSLDFTVEQLPDLVKKLAPYFNPQDFELLINQLIDPSMPSKMIQWDEPIGGIDCEAELGSEEINQNERYIPFVVSKFL